MKIETYVVDITTKEPLSFASTCLVNDAGEQQGSCTMVEEDGYLRINDPLLDQPGIYIEISASGYKTQRFSPQQAATGQIALTQKLNTISEVIVRAVKKQLPDKQKPYTVPIIFGSASLIVFTVWAYKTWF